LPELVCATATLRTTKQHEGVEDFGHGGVDPGVADAGGDVEGFAEHDVGGEAGAHARGGLRGRVGRGGGPVQLLRQRDRHAHRRVKITPTDKTQRVDHHHQHARDGQRSEGRRRARQHAAADREHQHKGADKFSDKLVVDRGLTFAHFRDLLFVTTTLYE